MSKGKHAAPKKKLTYMQIISLLSIFVGMVVGMYEQVVHYDVSEFDYYSRAFTAMFFTFAFLYSGSVIVGILIDEYAERPKRQRNE